MTVAMDGTWVKIKKDRDIYRDNRKPTSHLSLSFPFELMFTSIVNAEVGILPVCPSCEVLTIKSRRMPDLIWNKRVFLILT